MVVFAQNRVVGDSRLQRGDSRWRTKLNEGTSTGGEIVIGALIDKVIVHLLRTTRNMRRRMSWNSRARDLSIAEFAAPWKLMHAQLAADLSLKEIAALPIFPHSLSRVVKN